MDETATRSGKKNTRRGRRRPAAGLVVVVVVVVAAGNAKRPSADRDNKNGGRLVRVRTLRKDYFDAILNIIASKTATVFISISFLQKERE